MEKYFTCPSGSWQFFWSPSTLFNFYKNSKVKMLKMLKLQATFDYRDLHLVAIEKCLQHSVPSNFDHIF